MKNRKFALLLAVLMLLSLFAGCSGDNGSVTPTPSPGVAETSIQPSAEPVEETIAFKLPIVDEPTTLTGWRGWEATGLNIASANDIAANKWLAEQTNITVDWVCASGANITEAFNLMVASQDYEDMIASSSSTYAGGVDKAISDEVYLDASPFLEKYMPNYSALRGANDEVKKMSTTDSGNIFVGSVLNDDMFVWMGPMYRSDWAKELGYETIATYDDLHKFLSDVKTVKGIEEGLTFDLQSETNYFGLTSGYGTSLGYYQVDGKVIYGPENDGFREYLATLAQWYSEGLIWKKFTDKMDMQTPITRYGNEELAYMPEGYYGYAKMLPTMTGKGGEFKQTGFVTKEAGTKNHLRLKMTRFQPGYGLFVTAEAASRGVAELCYQWIDARFNSDIGAVLCFGIENEDWQYGADGSIEYAEGYLKLADENPKYGFERTDRLIACLDYANRDYAISKARGSIDVLEACSIWTDTADDAWVLPPTSLTAEEASEYSATFTDIQTYVEEFATGVIVGNTTLDDTTWKQFTEQLKTMGIEKCTGFQQAALDRYTVR